MIGALRYLAAVGFDAVSAVTGPVADAIWDEARRRRRPLAELTLLEEIADHAGVIRAQLEDIRNMMQLAAPATPVICTCGYAWKRSGVHVPGCPAAIPNGHQPIK